MNSLQVDVKAALGDSGFNDVLLVSKATEDDIDGSSIVKIPANRLILSLRSSVFREILFNDESISKSTFQIKYSGPVLKALVYFCYTDEIFKTEKRLSISHFRKDECPTFIGLMNAANDLKMKHLKRKILPLLAKLMARYQSVATSVVCHIKHDYKESASSMRRSKSSNSINDIGSERSCSSEQQQAGGRNNEATMLIELAKKIISVRPSSALTIDTLHRADPALLHQLFNEHICAGYEEMSIRLLEQWAIGSEERQKAAQQLVSSGCIKLDRLDPRVLGEFVDRAIPVVTKDAAFEAFRKQSENWAKGVAYADTLELLDAKHRDVVIVHGCDNPNVNGIYVYKPVGTINMYYKQDFSTSKKARAKTGDNSRIGTKIITVKKTSSNDSKTNSPKADNNLAKGVASSGTSSPIAGSVGGGSLSSRKSQEDLILDGSDKERQNGVGTKNAEFDNNESEAKTEVMHNRSPKWNSSEQQQPQKASAAAVTDNETGDTYDSDSNIYTLEADETDKTWYIKRGESDLLFKAPFEFPHHDFTKVPFDTWTVEDEDPGCTPPVVLFVSVASA